MTNTEEPPRRIRLPATISDRMVIQRDRTFLVHGWVSPGAPVTTDFAGRHAEAVCDADGRFVIAMSTPAAGGPYQLRILAGNDTLVVSDILVGEVWLCSGQSNMAWTLEASQGAADALAQADIPDIRFFILQEQSARAPAEDCVGAWQRCTPDSSKGFSAVAFFMARLLQQTLGVPVGIVQSARGGSAIEAWISRAAVESSPRLGDLAKHAANPDAPLAQPYDDPVTQPTNDWAGGELDPSVWSKMRLPQAWQEAGLACNGAVWFRREVEIPLSWAGRDLLVSLGEADDCDHSYFNQHLIGSIGTETPNCHARRRQYVVAGERVRQGRNVVAVRVFDRWGNGGLIGPADQMFICPVDASQQRIELTGDWFYRVELPLPLKAVDLGTLPCQLFNGMIHPLAKLNFRGVAWYQGENNTGNPEQYRELLSTLITDWRRLFDNPDLAWISVQLAGFHRRQSVPTGSCWAEVREAIAQAANELPHTFVTTAADLGDEEDIHPILKRQVGERLAATALRDVYHHQGVGGSGPQLKSFTFAPAAATLVFKDVTGGIVLRGDPSRSFALAGEDRIFHWAECELDSDRIRLHCPAVKSPIAVRYGWADMPSLCVYDEAGLPALPFRTDDWPRLVTFPDVQ